jgi:hypothetical protein
MLTPAVRSGPFLSNTWMAIVNTFRRRRGWSLLWIESPKVACRRLSRRTADRRLDMPGSAIRTRPGRVIRQPRLGLAGAEWSGQAG